MEYIFILMKGDWLNHFRFLLFIFRFLISNQKNMGQTTNDERELKTPSIQVKPEDLVVHKYGDKASTPLFLESVSFEVEILPSSKVYTQKTTLNFKNFCNKKLEGELVFPLPEDATICGYALQIGDDLVEATVVPKKKAQKVFDSEVRKGETVSIIEKVVGNQYKTKIYPLEANSTKIVQLEFISTLKSNEKGFYFEIPIESCLHSKLKKIDFTLNIDQSKDKKSLIELSDGKKNFEFKIEENGNLKKEFLEEELKNLDFLNIFLSLETKNIISIEKNLINQNFYFNISDSIEIQNQNYSENKEIENKEIEEKEKKNLISIIWDSSLSRQNLISNFEKIEFKFLKELISSSSSSSFKIDLYTFSNTLELIKEEIENFKILKENLNLIKYDGGTNIYQLNSLNLSKYDFCLLFTDGFDTLSRKDISPIKFKSTCPIYCLNSNYNSNKSYLEYISEITNGSHYYLNETNFKEISKKIGLNSFSFLFSEFNENEISDVFPSKSFELKSSSNFNFNGILLTNKETTITLNFGFGNKIKEKKIYKLKKSESSSESILSSESSSTTTTTTTTTIINESKIIGILWAKKYLNEMECFSEHFENEILSIGKQFNLVTKNTSLIILENLNQFIENKIIPPKERKSLYEEYLKKIEENEKIETKKINSKLEIVKGYWNEYMNWYKKDFVPSHLNKLKSETNVIIKEQEAKKIEIEKISEKLQKLKEEFKIILEKQKIENNLKLEEKKKEIEKEIEMKKVLYEQKKEEFERKKYDQQEERKKIEIYEEEKKRKEEEHMFRDHQMEEISMKKLIGRSEMLDEMYSPLSALQNQSEMLESSSSRFRSSAALSLSKEKSSLESNSSSASMKVKSWEPNVPYIKELKKTSKENLYETYLKLRNDYQFSPAFYLDCCDYFFKQNLKKESLKIISNLSELEFDSSQLLRIIGYKLEEIGELELSIQMFRKVLSLKPDEPQSYRDLALVLEKSGNGKEAIELLYKVIIGSWDSRFSEIEITALQELNRCIDLYGDFNIKIPDYLRNSTPLDLRIIMAWDTDMVDIDLHTIEPNGEEVYYSHKKSELGGLNSRDFTQGYGPETYSLKTAMPGIYKIKAKYYSSHQQSLTGGTTILLTLFTKYGIKNEENCQQITIRLNESKEIFQVAEIEIKNEKIEIIQNDLKKQKEIFEEIKKKFDEENQKIINEQNEQKNILNENVKLFEEKIREIGNNEELKNIEKLISQIGK